MVFAVFKLVCRGVTSFCVIKGQSLKLSAEIEMTAVDGPLLTTATAMAVACPSAGKVIPNRVQERAAFLSHHVVYYLLNEEGIVLNGFRNGAHKKPNKLLDDEAFAAAVSTLEKACVIMRRRHSEEITELVRTLEISEARLHQNFLKAVNTLMNDDIRWGRIVALFFFTSVLAERLYREGNQARIDSLVGWLGIFLNDTVVPWVSQQRGDWAAIKDAVNTDVHVPKSKATSDKGQSKGALFALAAVGVGFFVAGTLAIR